MCNVLSNSLFDICSGFVIKAHLVYRQDMCILVAFGYQLMSSPIHVLLCFLPSIASPGKTPGGNGIRQNFWLDVQFSRSNFLAEHCITQRIQIVSQFSFAQVDQCFFASGHYQFGSELRTIVISVLVGNRYRVTDSVVLPSL